MARIFFWGSSAAAMWPRFRSVMALELVVAIAIVAAASAVLITTGFIVIAKARMTEALQVASHGRNTIIEHFAVTGEALPSDVFTQGRGNLIVDVPEYEKHLSAARALAAVARGEPRNAPESRSEGSAEQLRYGVRDGALVVIGRMRHLERPYRLTFAAAVLPGPTAAVAGWVCGDAPVPHGFLLIGRAVPGEVPPDLLFHQCRAQASP